MSYNFNDKRFNHHFMIFRTSWRDSGYSRPFHWPVERIGNVDNGNTQYHKTTSTWKRISYSFLNLWSRLTGGGLKGSNSVLKRFKFGKKKKFQIRFERFTFGLISVTQVEIRSKRFKLGSNSVTKVQIWFKFGSNSVQIRFKGSNSV